MQLSRTSRRNFLSSLAHGALSVGTRKSFAATVAKSDEMAAVAGKTAVPMLHSADLNRPHDDPDDHWDLACVFALAHAGKVELEVMIDYPQLTAEADFKATGPDVMGVAQMNYILGKSAPVTIGLRKPMLSRHDTIPDAKLSEDIDVHAVLRLLRE